MLSIKRAIFLASSITGLLTLHSCKRFDHVQKHGVTCIGFDTLRFEENTISIGDSDDVVVPGLKKGTLRISYNRSANLFHWEMKAPMGLKFNGDNPNLVSLDTVTALIVNGQQWPASSFSHLKFDDQNFLPLGKALTLISGSKLPEDIRSLFEPKKKYFLLLDTLVKVRCTSGIVRGFRKSGSLSADKLTVEFFGAAPYSVFPRDSSRDYLHIGRTSYHVLLSRRFTGFGASLIKIQPGGQDVKGLEVSFDKPYRQLFMDTVAASIITQNNGLPVDIVQQYQDQSAANNLVVPNFSFTNQGILGTLESAGRLTLEEPFISERIPPLLLCFCPLLFVYLFLLMRFVVVAGYGLPRFLFVHLYMPHQNASEKKAWMVHFLWLLTILWVFLMYRIFIAYQLAYTAPYFVFTLPATIIIAPFMLVAVIGCWLVLISKFSIIIPQKQRREYAEMKLRSFCLLLFLLAGAMLICSRVPGVNEFISVNRWRPASLWGVPELLKTRSGPLIAVATLIIILLIHEFSVFLVLRFTVQKEKKVRNYRVALGATVVFLLIMAVVMDNAYSCLLLPAMLLAIYILYTTRFKYWAEGAGERPLREIYFKAVCCVIITSGCLAFASVIKHDTGYFINILMIWFAIVLVLLFENNKLIWGTGIRKRKAALSKIWVITSLLLLVIFFIGWIYVRTRPVSVTNFSGRTYTRLTTYYDFDKVGDAGYKSTEGFAQFFAILSKYVMPDGPTAVAGAYHPGISGFSDPVVLNDLSFPAAGIAVWGNAYWVPVLLLILCWVLLFRTVLLRSLYACKAYDKDHPSERHNVLTSFGMIRIICVSYLAGSGLWLIGSYYGLVPFTGRLLFGFGQDSVAEALETIILFAGMGLIYPVNQIKSQQ